MNRRDFLKSSGALVVSFSMRDVAFAQAILETVRRSGLKDAYIRPVISRGRGDLGIDPRKCPCPTIIIIVDTIQLYPDEAYRKGLRLVTTSTRQRPVDVLNPRIKTCNYLNNIMARLEANLVGADEGLDVGFTKPPVGRPTSATSRQSA